MTEVKAGLESLYAQLAARAQLMTTLDTMSSVGLGMSRRWLVAFSPRTSKLRLAQQLRIER